MTNISDYEILLSAVIGWASAQILKTLIYLLINKKFVAERLVGTGGMPSSHSATVCGLCSAIAVNYGMSSVEFAISAIFAIVVMVDALGVRRETGRQAVVLNEMMEFFKKMGTEMTATDRLKEFIGHSPLQVLVGALMGIGIGILVCYLL